MALALTTAPAAHADETSGVRLTGAQIALGIVSPDDAGTAIGFGGRLNVGSLASALRMGVGVLYWSSDIDGDGLDDDVDATISDLAIDVDLRFMPARVSMLRPYVVTALALHFVSADISGANDLLEDALTGTHIGVDIGIGAESAGPGVGWRAELRRRFVSDVESWQGTIGLRYVFGSDG
jgi:hypothetical protein